MFSDFSDLCFQLRQRLKIEGHSVSLGHTQQLAAAALGYRSLAALQASQEERPGLVGAAYLVVDFDLLESRANQLEMGSIGTVLYSALQGVTAGQIEVFSSDEEFFEEVVVPYVQEDVTNKDPVNSEMAMTNAYVNYVDVETDSCDALSDAGEDDWVIELTGSVNMDSDPEKAFWGDHIRFEGEIIYPRVGRRCIGGEGRLRISSARNTIYDSDSDSANDNGDGHVEDGEQQAVEPEIR